MSAELAGLVLAAGAGTRLRPLSALRPKPLCPVGFDPLLGLALDRVDAALGGAAGLAVNLCPANGGSRIEEWLRSGPWHDRVHRSPEDVALGTAGAVGPLRPWLDGRGLLVVNGDTWCPGSLRSVVDDWDGRSVAVAVSVADPPPPAGGAAPAAAGDRAPAVLHARSRIVASVLPWEQCRSVEARPAGLWELVWRDRLAAGDLQVLGIGGPFVDCATPGDYLRANLDWLRWVSMPQAVHPTAIVGRGATVEGSVVGAGASVAGSVRRSVVWPGAVVGPDEDLVGVVRTDSDLTVSGVG